MDLSAFAAAVGRDGPVTVVGGRTQWEVGGRVEPGTRELRAPVGIVEYEPAEMTVRCGAGTTVREVDAALGEHGQLVALPDAAGATVGGVLAVGHSGVRRLGYGPVRDVLLEARYVSAEGTLIKAGGPTVKNVSGFDLCRLLVGSLGTIGLLGEVCLRCRPRPVRSQWYVGEADPFALHRQLHRPTSILWDGTTTWVLLEGHSADVDHQARLTGLAPVEGPPPIPTAGRRSLRPSELQTLAGDFVAEIGVGIVHLPHPVDPPPPERPDLHQRIKATFDPTGRLNPGQRTRMTRVDGAARVARPRVPEMTTGPVPQGPLPARILPFGAPPDWAPPYGPPVVIPARAKAENGTGLRPVLSL